MEVSQVLEEEAGGGCPGRGGDASGPGLGDVQMEGEVGGEEVREREPEPAPRMEMEGW